MKSAQSTRLEKIAAWRAENRERVLEHKRRYYQRHKAQHAQWKKANPEKVKASRANGADKNRKRTRVWQALNHGRVIEAKRRYDHSQAEKLTDLYIRKLLARHHGPDLAKAIPVQLIEAIRANLQLKRLCRNLKTSKH